MAANKATVNVSASVLPDDMKASIGGTIVYDLNDMAGDVSKWIYYVNEVAARVQQVQAQIGVAGGYNATAAGYVQAAQGFIGTAQSYANEIQSKIAISQAYANEAQVRLAVDTKEYEWLMGQQAKLQADYDKGLQILMGGRAMPQQQ